MPRRLVITLDTDLPYRSKALDAVTLSGIFGGCGFHGAGCKSDLDCCKTFVNNPAGFFVNKCKLVSTNPPSGYCAYLPH